jgi:hypothetical protein
MDIPIGGWEGNLRKDQSTLEMWLIVICGGRGLILIFA